MSEKQIEKLQPLVYDITDPGYREADAQDLADVGTEVVVSYDAVQVREAALAAALKECVNALTIFRRFDSTFSLKTKEDLEFLWSKKDYAAQENACRLLAQIGAEEGKLC
jgi:hypothetical protein